MVRQKSKKSAKRSTKAKSRSRKSSGLKNKRTLAIITVVVGAVICVALIGDWAWREHHRPTPAQKQLSVTTTAPPTKNLPVPNACSGKPVVMNIVAHPDDDILFMNPDISRDLANGDCLFSVFLTAGNAGASDQYWLRREEGMEVAYSRMYNSNEVWRTEYIQMENGSVVTVDTLSNNHKLALIFMRLPDGNLDGRGFPSTQHQSLARLMSGAIPEIGSVDGKSKYTKEELLKVLAHFMNTYNPTEVNTQSPHNLNAPDGDHSDHLTNGQLVDEAWPLYSRNKDSTLRHFVGYPIRDLPSNLDDADTKNKTRTFLAYSRFDPRTCETYQACMRAHDYTAYFSRQYTLEDLAVHE